jgi:hypothetical protein
VYKPDHVSTVTGGSIPFTVFDTVGQPVPNLQLSLWKPPAPPAPQQAGARGTSQMAASDEVFDNTYTDVRGDATLSASPVTPGWLYFTLQDDLGHSMLDSIEVISPTAVAPSRPGGLQFAAMPSVARAGTRLGFGAPLADPARIVLVDVAGRTVRRLEAQRGDTAVRWAGDDDAGRAVAPGLYLATLESGTTRARTRVIVVR